MLIITRKHSSISLTTFTEKRQIQMFLAMGELTRHITSDQILVPYNPKLPLILSTDISALGLGTVLDALTWSAQWM